MTCLASGEQNFLYTIPAGSTGMEALLIGCILDIVLFGILTVQSYLYYSAFPDDRITIKLAVAGVYSTGIAQTMLVLLDIFNQASTMKFDNNDLPLPQRISERAVSISDHFWFSVVLSGAVVALTVQSIYAHRIYTITNHRWIPTAFIIVCSVGQFLSGIIGCTCNLHPSTIGGSDIATDDEPTGVCRAGFQMLWGPLNVLCDLSIVLCMSMTLWQQRKRTLKRRTHMHIMRVVQLIIQTGITTSVTVLCFTILINLSPSVSATMRWYLIPGLAMGKVYSNSMLALLNNRASIIGGRNIQLNSDNATFGMRTSIIKNSSGVESDETVEMQRLATAQRQET